MSSALRTTGRWSRLGWHMLPWMGHGSIVLCAAEVHSVVEPAVAVAMLTFSAMASPTASAACVVDFRLFENPRQPAEMHDCTLPFVSDSVMMVLLFELMIETIPACKNLT